MSPASNYYGYEATNATVATPPAKRKGWISSDDWEGNVVYVTFADGTVSDFAVTSVSSTTSVSIARPLVIPRFNYSNNWKLIQFEHNQKRQYAGLKTKFIRRLGRPGLHYKQKRRNYLNKR